MSDDIQNTLPSFLHMTSSYRKKIMIYWRLLQNIYKLLQNLASALQYITNQHSFYHQPSLYYQLRQVDMSYENSREFHEHGLVIFLNLLWCKIIGQKQCYVDCHGGGIPLFFNFMDVSFSRCILWRKVNILFCHMPAAMVFCLTIA
jgi:hypothetical protein